MTEQDNRNNEEQEQNQQTAAEQENQEQAKKETAQQEQQVEEPADVGVAHAGAVEGQNGEQPAHDDFDWDLFDENKRDYSEEQEKELRELYESTLTDIAENEIVTASVVGKTGDEVVLNIGFKSDGLVPLTEFRDMDEVNVGDTVDVYVEQKEDERGRLRLSRRKAKLLKAWRSIVDAYENETIIRGTIVSKTKGGLIVNVQGLETFLPGSQIDVKPIIDYDAYVGETMDFKVVKINEAIKNAVVSHKALIESDLEQQRQEIISGLEKGQVLEGTIKNITDFGAFIDLGGVDGLLYITDISWGRINHPSEVLELNQNLNVVVLDFDDDKKRISLGLKQLQPHPWDVLPEDIQPGAKVKGKVVNIEDYGAFLEIKPGVEGLVHVSEVSWSNQPINAREYFKLGDEYDAVVMTLDKENRKMSLSIKQLTEDPWSNIREKYPVQSKHTGEVKNITPYGVFVELEEGIGGMIHISDLSWTKRYSHPSEYTKVGDELEVVVLEIDEENRKMSLGHKQIEEDPWDTFETVFPEGSVHEGTVLRQEDKGAIVLMPYGIEAFAPNRHMKKENGGQAEVDETLDFKILEFNRDDKRIIVSHSRVHEDAKKEAKREEEQKREQEDEQARKEIQKSNKQSSQQPTLGDEVDALSDLKKSMQDTEKESAQSKSTSSTSSSGSGSKSKSSSSSSGSGSSSTAKSGSSSKSGSKSSSSKSTSTKSSSSSSKTGKSASSSSKSSTSKSSSKTTKKEDKKDEKESSQKGEDEETKDDE